MTPRRAVIEDAAGSALPIDSAYRVTVRGNDIPARPAAGRSAAPEPAARTGDRLPLLVLLAIPIVATVLGFPYYLLGAGERLRSPLHEWLKPSGTIGLAFGVAGFALFLFMWLYPLRKRYRWLAFTGALPGWLRLHTIAGLGLPLLVAVHAGWRFEGLIGLGYLAMVLVALSGIVGRYLYVRIPRGQSGLELTREEAMGERRALVTHIAVTTRLDPLAVERSLAVDARSYDGLGPFRTIARMIADDFARQRAMRRIKREWSRSAAGKTGAEGPALSQALRLARRELALTQQIRMLDATRRVFALWHVAHRPFAMTALIAVLVHVAVAAAVGVIGWG